MLQRYVSKELAHFLGRHLPSDDERYKLLLKILTEGLLKGTLKDDITVDQIREGKFYIGEIPIRDKDMSFFNGKNELKKTPAVCFCDIPVNDLGIHMDKYGKFGLSFLKEFLIEKRANPVFYIAIDSKPSLRGASITTKKALYDEQFNAKNNSLFSPGDRARLKSGGLGDIYNKLDRFMRFLSIEILPFLKLFECNKSDLDKENYYMEREWRILGGFEFNINDISRIILPKSYIRRFKDDVPDYCGKITFADDYSLPE